MIYGSDCNFPVPSLLHLGRKRIDIAGETLFIEFRSRRRPGDVVTSMRTSLREVYKSY
jgi:hypothetical protein